MGLRDMLDKQRAERAAQQTPVEQKPSSAPVQTTETKTAPVAKPQVGGGMKSGLLATLARKATANGSGNGAATRPVPTLPIPSPKPIAKPAPAPTAPSPSATVEQFADMEIDLSPPTKSMDGAGELKRQIAFLAAHIEEKELVGQVVRVILKQLKGNPQFSTALVDTDYDMIMRGARRAYNIAARKKTEAREAKTTKKAAENEFASFMKESGMEDWDLK